MDRTAPLTTLPIGGDAASTSNAPASEDTGALRVAPHSAVRPAASGTGCCGAVPYLVAVLLAVQLWNAVREHWDGRLQRAAADGRLAEVRRLLRSGVPADMHPHVYNRTPLMQAAGHGHVQVVQELLAAGADVSRVDGFNTNALLSTIAGRPERYKIARLLLEHGSDVNCQETAFRRTPLIKAASRGDVPMLRLLLGWGARCDLRDREGRTALEVARQCRSPEAARFLEQACAEPPARSRAP